MKMRPKMPGGSFSTSPMASGTEGFPFANYTEEMARPKPFEDSSSSIIALMVVLTLACAVIVTSLVTFYCHKSQLRGRKLQKALEEYERDHGKGVKEQGTGTATLAYCP